MPIAYICATCGAQYPPSETPPSHCPICMDERQYVRAEGQSWTTPEELRASRSIDWRSMEPSLAGMGATPQIAIGQRALILSQPGGGIMWDSIPLVTEDGIARIRAAGGVRAMAISHPHFFSAMADWSKALGDIPIYLHDDLRPYVTRPEAPIRFWSGETCDLGEGVTLIRCGGHFSGSTVLHWAAGAERRGALFTADTITVTADPRWLSFMRSYPILIPLNRRAVEGIVAAVAPFPFDRIYGGWWQSVLAEDAKARLAASAERYVRAIAD
jgi:glyoxylase-like metal-dependent hydrolase (beta-lactamase superfamily II)